MLNFRRLPALLPHIIGAGLLLVFLGGCSAVRIGYNNAPALAYWWLDSYIDFNDAQAMQVRDSLNTLQAWHRKTELPAYAELLRQMQGAASGPVTPQQACEFSDRIRLHVQRLGEQAAEGMSRVVPTLQPEQLRHLALQFDKHNKTWREEWLDGTPAELSARRLKKAVERAENFYGRLEEPQLSALRQSLSRSSFDPRLSWQWRLSRQQDMLRVFKEHGNGDRTAHVKAEMLALLQRNLNSPEAAYRDQFEQMLSESCRTLATLHNSTNAAQRRQLLEKLQAYEADARALAADK
ncbi:MAG: DUF6279 family lipoprotein [Pseudomonadota bacterium]|nr:DUF6279 family lipoprotein [Pseudomonadota bacterium]